MTSDELTRETHTRALVVQLGAAMIATGQPVNEIQAELMQVTEHLGYPGAQVGIGPTGLTLSLTDGGAATIGLAATGLQLDQSFDVRRIRHQLVYDQITPEAAREQLAALRLRPQRYNRWLVRGAWIVLAMGITMILQAGWANLVVAAASSLIVIGLVELSAKSTLLASLLPTAAAFGVALVVFTVADYGLIEGPLRTVLPPLAVLLPGALLVTGMSELAAGHMQAGSARLTYGVVQLALFALGLLAAATLLQVPARELANVRVYELGWWAAPVGLVLIGLSICLMEGVPLRMQGWILLVLTGAFAAQILGQQLGSYALGGFMGAVAASLGATIVELFRPRLARLVLFLPAFWLLVPGSLGLVEVTSLVSDQEQAIQAAFGVFAVISAIALGLLVGSAMGQSITRRLRPAPALAYGRG